MCQLLGMNCATPTDITFSFSGFARRGGGTDHHADGWGIGFFEDKACRLFIDHEPAATSPLARLVRELPIKSRNVIAHIRKATQGEIRLENCHPFVRELGGRHWLFAHNGNLADYRPALDGVYRPVGDTDSERAFCALLQGLRDAFPGQGPTSLDAAFDTVAGLIPALRRHGEFNFLLSNGQGLLAHGTSSLWYVVREWPFREAHLADLDMSIDFSRETSPKDRVAVIATAPLTDNEEWTRFEPDELILFVDGKPLRRARTA